MQSSGFETSRDSEKSFDKTAWEMPLVLKDDCLVIYIVYTNDYKHKKMENDSSPLSQICNITMTS